MAATTTADWVSCHRDDQGDKGTIEALCSLDDGELAEISKTHNNNVGALPRTIVPSSGGGNFLLVPGAKGTGKVPTRDSPPPRTWEGQ